MENDNDTWRRNEIWAIIRSVLALPFTTAEEYKNSIDEQIDEIMEVFN